MTRYDPNTVPIMQNWSKWPFHTKESRGVEINAAPPSLLSAILFFLPHFCFTIPCLFKLQWLCTCLHDICSGQKKKKGKPAAYQINLTSVHKAIFLHIPTRRNAFIRSHVVFPSSCVCLFFACLGLFFVPHLCRHPPTTNATSSLSPSTARHLGHVKTSTQRQVTRTGADFSGHQWRRRDWEPS